MTKKKNQKTKYDPQKIVDNWNREHPVGTKVIVTKDSGTKVHTEITAPCTVLCGTPVAWLKDIPGGYDLERVTPESQ